MTFPWKLRGLAAERRRPSAQSRQASRSQGPVRGQAQELSSDREPFVALGQPRLLGARGGGAKRKAQLWSNSRVLPPLESPVSGLRSVGEIRERKPGQLGRCSLTRSLVFCRKQPRRGWPAAGSLCCGAGTTRSVRQMRNVGLAGGPKRSRGGPGPERTAPLTVPLTALPLRLASETGLWRGAQDTLTPHLDSGPGRRCPPRARCSGSCTQRW